VNAPSAPAAGSASGSSATTAPATTTTTPAAAAAIGAPSLTTSNLQPWDPRACPAGATPTAPVANQT
jgi:hypothetical protein